MTGHEASLRIVSSLEEVERASLWLQNEADAAGLPKAVTATLMIAMDEVVTNVIRHGRAPEGKMTIGLNIKINPAQLTLTVTDSCQEFDPTVGIADRAKSRSGTRRIGGAGLLFVRSLMDGIEYTRLGGCNRLILSKRLSPEAG